MAENQAATLLFIYAETPLHPGTGASLGVVDLPIQRERTTLYPIMQSSSLKGVLRAMATPAKDTPNKDRQELVNRLFGAENQDYAGAVSLADAKLLLFPVRSLSGVFTWITCPAVLARLKRDLAMGGQTTAWQLPTDESPKEGHVLLPQNSTSIVATTGKVALEEFLFTPETDTTLATNVAEWIATNAFPESEDFEWWRNKLKRSLVIMHDNDFRDFVTTATEVIARTRLESETKKVVSGALWYQEFLPSETVFYSVVVGQAARKSPDQASTPVLESLKTPTQVLTSLKGLGIERIQIGGDETTGKGFCKLRYL